MRRKNLSHFEDMLRRYTKRLGTFRAESKIQTAAGEPFRTFVQAACALNMSTSVFRHRFLFGRPRNKCLLRMTPKLLDLSEKSKS